MISGWRGYTITWCNLQYCILCLGVKFDLFYLFKELVWHVAMSIEKIRYFKYSLWILFFFKRSIKFLFLLCSQQSTLKEEFSLSAKSDFDWLLPSITVPALPSNNCVTVSLPSSFFFFNFQVVYFPLIFLDFFDDIDEILKSDFDWLLASIIPQVYQVTIVLNCL